MKTRHVLDRAKVANIFIIICFLLILAVPIARINWKKNQVSEIDNRKLAEFPDVERGADFQKDFEAFLLDRIGFRNDMIGAYQRICDVLFAKLVHPTYMYGERGYIFFKGEYIDDYQHLNINKVYIKKCAKYLKMLYEYLESRNIRFVYFLTPDKKTVYGEYFPRTIYVRGNKSQAEMLIDEIKRLKIPYIYPLWEFLKAKRNQNIYNIKYDAGHWNEHGAFIGHSLITKKLRNYFPSIKLLTKSDFIVSMTKARSLLVSHFEIDEDVPRYTRKHRETVEIGIYNALFNLDSYQFQFFQNKAAIGKPKILVVRDSAFVDIEKYYGDNFYEIISVHSFENLKNIEYFINIFEPDVVLLENAERVISPKSMLFSNGNMRKTILHDFADLNLPYNDMKGSITVNAKENVVFIKELDILSNITGSASIFREDNPGSSLYARVNGRYYAADYPDAEAGRKTAFSLTLKTETLRKAGKIEFILISSDGRSKSQPVAFSIITEK